MVGGRLADDIPESAASRRLRTATALGRRRDDKSKMPRNPRRAPNLSRGRAHADRSTFPSRLQLEDQMTNFTSDIDRAAARYSPDRVDAVVWAVSELLVEPMNGKGIFELYRRDAEAAAQRSKPQPTQTLPQPGSMEWFEAQKKKG